MWKVIDALPHSSPFASYSKGEMYGPLPVKTWVRDIPQKRHKLSYKTPKAHTGNGPSSAKDYTSGRAVLYAEWLAKRDVLEVPKDCKVCLCWSDVTVPAKGRREPRVYAVCWDRHTYAKATGTTVTRALTVAIPHWDWVPAAPCETLDLLCAA